MHYLFKQAILSMAQIRKIGTNKSCKVGFIGLGNMGSEMCKNLIMKEYDVVVKDLDPKRESDLATKGAKVATNYGEIADHADYIITMLPASQHVLDLYCGEKGLIKHLKRGTTAIDCSTVDFTTPKTVGGLLEKRGVSFIDAPVSGGVIAASNASLTFMVGGKEETLRTAEPILLSMGSKVYHCGPLGSGQIAKMCNNLLLAISAVGVSEIFHLGTKLGMDPKILTSIINHSSGRCWVTDTYHPVPNVLENVPSSRGYKAGFTSQMLLKDLKIAERTAAEVQCKLNVGEVVLNLYTDLCSKKLADKDFTVIYDYIMNYQNNENENK